MESLFYLTGESANIEIIHKRNYGQLHVYEDSVVNHSVFESFSPNHLSLPLILHSNKITAKRFLLYLLSCLIFFPVSISLSSFVLSLLFSPFVPFSLFVFSLFQFFIPPLPFFFITTGLCTISYFYVSRHTLDIFFSYTFKYFTFTVYSLSSFLISYFHESDIFRFLDILLLYTFKYLTSAIYSLSSFSPLSFFLNIIFLQIKIL